MDDKKYSNGIPEPHEYDGIVEEENDLPRWWLVTFYLTVIFGVLYFCYYQLGLGSSSKEEFDSALEAHKKQFAAQASTAGLSETELESLEKDVAVLKKGKDIFTQRCAVCHGPEGQGQIGPNLTDDYWIHGTGKPAEIALIVKEGVATKGMPPWGPILSNDELKEVVVFVHSLRGTHPSHPKPPQGELHSQ